MSARPPLVDREKLGELVRQIIAEVLMVPVERVRPETVLVIELGAESIDFVDLIFRLEQALGKKIPLARWGDFVKERLAGKDLTGELTTDIVREFAEREAESQS